MKAIIKLKGLLEIRRVLYILKRRNISLKYEDTKNLWGESITISVNIENLTKIKRKNLLLYLGSKITNFPEIQAWIKLI